MRTRRVEAPYLQLVMQRLWEVERERGSDVLRAATLAELGGAERIVKEHLERALEGLGEETRSRRSPLQPPRHPVRDENRARRGRPRALCGSRSGDLEHVLGSSGGSSHPSPRPRQVGRAAALRDLPRRARARDPDLARPARGRACARARTGGGAPTSPAHRRGRRGGPARVRGDDGARALGALAAVRRAGESGGRGSRRAHREGAPASGERPTRARAQPRAWPRARPRGGATGAVRVDGGRAPAGAAGVPGPHGGAARRPGDRPRRSAGRHARGRHGEGGCPARRRRDARRVCRRPAPWLADLARRPQCAHRPRHPADGAPPSGGDGRRNRSGARRNALRRRGAWTQPFRGRRPA